ncbi:MAG: hypothetical protein JWP34_4577, partial [Massilia sp.]|nr:hypothetical protein [Massilia sp.]
MTIHGVLMCVRAGAIIPAMRFHAFGLVAAICCLSTLARGVEPIDSGNVRDISLIPLPRSFKTEGGSLALTKDSRIVAGSPELAPLATILSDEIRRTTGVRLETASGADRPGDVLLALNPTLKGEAYSLDVTAIATVIGANYDAVASGTATLLQALKLTDGRPVLPHLRIADEPAFAFRGVLIDVARKYHSPGGIKQVIELCRLYKIRYLHVHISDDQLFMFPSTAFPQAGKGNREFARFEPGSKPHVDPYTLAELKDLEQFSKDRGVHIVPELDLPGHSGRLVGDAPEIFGFPGNGSTVNIASPKTLAAVKTLLNEVMDVFQSTPYVHLGADEVGLGGLESTPEYKEMLANFPSIKSPHDLYCKFIVDLHDIVAARGKKAIVWEEAWNPGGAFPLPKDTLVMVWSQGRNPNDIVKSGYEIANATWTPLYIVRDNKKSLEFLFDWELAKFGREGSNEYTILKDTTTLAGAQLCSWEDSESIEIQSLRDRLALAAERAWNPQAGGTFAAFKSRLAHTDSVLEKLVNPVAIHVDGQLVRDENTFAEPITITLSPQSFVDQAGLTIRYTLDNSLPDAGWKPYTAPIELALTAHLRAGLFDKQGGQHGYLVGGWYRRIAMVKPNLATHKPVTVGPSPDRDDAWSAKVAVDGKADEPNGHWASSGAAPQWLQIDLEKSHPVDFINVITYWDGSRSYQLTAEVSEDGK